MKTDKELKEVFLMQSIALSNYARLCNKLNEVPRIEVIDQLSNCEDVKSLIESNKIFLENLKK